MAAGNPNQPSENPTTEGDPETLPGILKINCGNGIFVYPPAQCPVCGNDICEYGEDSSICENDC